MDHWDFDAPQYVDFTQPEIHEEAYDDSWFDRHTEEDDFLLLNKDGLPGSETKAEIKKPQRVLRNTGEAYIGQTGSGKVEIVDTSCKSPRYLNGKPSRVLVEKHESQTSMKTMCPSPRKRQKLSTEGHCSTTSSSSPNTARQANSSSDHPETTPLHKDSPAANTRTKTPIKEIDSKSPKTQPTPPKRNLKAGDSHKANGSHEEIETAARKVPNKQTTLQRSQSLRCRVPSKTGSLTHLNRLEQTTLNNSSKDKLTDSSLNLNSVSRTKTTEQLELEKIAAIKLDVAKTRKLAEESYKKSMATNVYIPVRSCQPPTVTVGFHFKTDERIKNSDGHSQEHKVKDFAKSLREALPKQVLPSRPQVNGLTKPEPFKLTSAKSTSSLVQSEKYESVAERVIAFHRKTPDRFRSNCHGPKERSRSANNRNAPGQATRVRSPSPKLTVAKTPTLTARARARPVNAISQEEKEQLEYEEHQKQQFKANPVNPKVFGAPALPKVQPKPVTAVEEFNLHSQSSASDLIALVEKDTEEKYEFHARPVNPKIMAGPVGVKHVEPKPVTIPESPAFALKNRVRPPVELPEREEMKECVKANPVPYSGIRFKPRLPHHHTVPEPFTVEERSRAMLTRRDNKIQKILEDEKKAREFYAQDVPKDTPDVLPPKHVKPATLPEPFNLMVDDRGERYQRELKLKLEEEERLAREIATFKAGPNNVIHKEPFLAVKSGKPLTEKNNFTLKTDVRATQREVFDQLIKAKEAEIEAMKRQREERLEREEQKDVARMRAQAVHKATSIKRYTTVEVKPSDKPLTDAHSPRFSKRLRCKPTDV